jgi:hypothetical protein
MARKMELAPSRDRSVLVMTTFTYDRCAPVSMPPGTVAAMLDNAPAAKRDRDQSSQVRLSTAGWPYAETAPATAL